ncbi:helix-turn-helix domain-containing protein [Haloglomus salinum]|uniref:helix-turn-helix domain-containing protein n=1 Tax=Haloglomus salinum TaxID=2962673 RepID=UPI0020CA02E1|nr:helix-turn-helix domain-containing protein [Haloglomus salinum]
MKFARVRVSLEESQDTPIHSALADTTASDTVRVRYGGFSEDGPRTYVCSVTGDVSALDSRLAVTEGILSHEFLRRQADYAVIHLVSELNEYEIWLQRVFTEQSLTMIPPVDVEEGYSFVFRLLGQPEDLQQAIGDASEQLPLDVERVGNYHQPDERITASLTDRQIEAVEKALAVGYYDIPREGTAEEVAAALDCAPSTASQHLRKAESALVQAVFEGDMFN